jgi:membrane-bound lytic murein transglycosylase A
MLGAGSRVAHLSFVFGLVAAAGAAANARELPAKIRNAQVAAVSFDALSGWKDDNHAEAYAAFLSSCRAILNGTKAMRKARPVYGGLFEVCERAKAAGPLDRDQARVFFERNFKPVRLAQPGESQGFFTGYYETEVHGSRVRTEEYNVPLYAAPAAAIRKNQSKVFPNLDRGEIEDGALKGKGLEICWVKNPVDAFFAQIQGSTRVKLEDGKLLRLNYVASNGMKYYPVGRDLIDRGIIAKEDMSMDKIRAWMDANPEEGKTLRRKNKSFVFFTETPLAAHEECIGAQGVPLTPLRSLAVDKKLHVYGTPIWIDAELPIESEKPETKFQRLLIAQDTGSAIVGPARADIYFGAGEEVGSIAGRIKQFGNFVMLVPRSIPVKGDSAPANVPLPKQRPKDIVADAKTDSTSASAKAHR